MQLLPVYMSRIANSALLGGGVRVRVRFWIREQRKIKRRSKALLRLCWQHWTSLAPCWHPELSVLSHAQYAMNWSLDYTGHAHLV